MRISDWSSDVCASDLDQPFLAGRPGGGRRGDRDRQERPTDGAAGGDGEAGGAAGARQGHRGDLHRRGFRRTRSRDRRTVRGAGLMDLLLDTHVVIWWNDGGDRLSGPVRAILADPRNRIFVSAATPWEIAIKPRQGRFAFLGPPDHMT